jgi:tetratricopeptide (TPR) repeat protein
VTAEASAHVNAPVPSIAERCRGLPPELDAVFKRALAKDPAARYGSAAEFVADIRDALARAAGTTGNLTPVPLPAPAPSRPRLLLPALLLLIAAAVGALVAVLVTRGGGNPAARVVTMRVTGPAGKVTTVRETVTRQQTVTAPAPAPPPPPPVGSGANGHSLNDQGYQLIQQGNFTGAIPVLQQAVRKLSGTGPADPYEAYANYNLGYALYRSGRCAEAVPYLQRAETLEPERHEPKQIRKRAERCS